MIAPVRRYAERDEEAIVELSLAAWAPVFASAKRELGDDAYRLIYPDWKTIQGDAVRAVCDAREIDVWVATDRDRPIGFVATRLVDEGAASAGEVYMIAVDPRHQRAGVGTALLQRAIDELRTGGAELIAIGTGGDPGHAPARALYEKAGFRPTRQVRYHRRP